MMALLASAWTPWAGSSPSDVTQEMFSQVPNRCISGAGCIAGSEDFRMHWVSQTGNGNLYLMVRKDCRDGSDCGALFVENTSQGLAARLNIAGRFQVLPRGESVPDVQSWRAVRDNEFEITRYRWSAGIFQKVEQRTVYYVDGRECGSAMECFAEAQAAHQNHHTDRALRILDTVHNVSYI